MSSMVRTLNRAMAVAQRRIAGWYRPNKLRGSDPRKPTRPRVQRKAHRNVAGRHWIDVATSMVDIAFPATKKHTPPRSDAQLVKARAKRARKAMTVRAINSRRQDKKRKKR